MARFLTVRQSAAIGVAAVASEAVLSAASPINPGRERLIGHLTSAGLPSVAHVLALLVGLALLVLVPGLWRGTRTAVSLAIVGLLLLALLSLVKGLEYEEAIPEACLALLLIWGRSAFPLGCGNRPRLAVVCAALAAWALTYCALLAAPLVSGRRRHPLGQDLHRAIAHVLRARVAAPHVTADWTLLIDLMIACAVAISVLAVRSALRPAASANGHVEHEYRAARAIVQRYGEDSLSPFVLRPDKALHFAAGGVLSYRVIGGTAVVSSDPVAPGEAAPDVLQSFLGEAHRRGWPVALWGASARNLDAYRALGLRAICAGEEAFVDPSAFTLEGRPVRKLRQSVHRVKRRGWKITVQDGRAIDGTLEAEIKSLEHAWRAGQRHMYGFAMAMGEFESEVAPDDLYVLARSRENQLGAVMRFAAHGQNLSLDTMRRVGETPNGLNEALVATALEVARERGIKEVSLNYAGLGHLVRGEPSRNPIVRLISAVVMAPLHRRFQMDRLVRFNDKFSPQWRPRYLVYESRTALPRAIMRVLQAEGYLPEPRRPRWRRGRLRIPRALPRSPHAKSAG
ncbi:MAG: bifunctional lysylphosphatidylglycerol flippase/synthetase MprF [Solirubrobacteraceae bacterium]